MRDRPGIGVEALLLLFGARAHEGTATDAMTYLGASLVHEALLSIRAIARALASG
jgi:hypothetical protein